MSVASRFWVRRLTSIAIVLVLIAIAVVITQRFNKFRTPVAQVDSDEVAHEGSDRMVGVYTGFEFVERVAGRLIFELASKRTLGLASGWHEIEGVRLQFYRDGEPGPILTCDGASFNIQTRDATLEGSIRIVLPSGAMLTTEAGKFEASSRRFATNSEVRFISGASLGRAQGAVFFCAEHRVVYNLDRGIINKDGMNGFGDLGAANHAYFNCTDRHVFKDSACLFNDYLRGHRCKRHHIHGILYRCCSDNRSGNAAVTADGFNVSLYACAASRVSTRKA